MATERYDATSVMPADAASARALAFELAVPVIAGVLAGFGIILWVAANWPWLDRHAQFGLIATVIAAANVAAVLSPRMRIPAILVSFCATGGLFAHFGQVYQTGGDPWQLFALWALISLPLVAVARHDVTWSAWIIVVFTAIPLWSAQHLAIRGSAMTLTMLTGWCMAAVATAAVSPWLGTFRWRGDTKWAFRLAVLLFGAMVVGHALMALVAFRTVGVIYLAGLGLFGAAVAMLANRRPLDLPLLTGATIGLDILVIGGLWRVLASGGGAGVSGMLLLIGIATLIVIGVSVAALLSVYRRSVAADAESNQILRVAGDWPITILSAVGAVLAALPLFGFLGILFGRLLLQGAAPAIAGAFLVGLALAAHRWGRLNAFAQQFAFVAILIGLTLIDFWVRTKFGMQVAYLAIAVLVTGVAVVGLPRWMAAVAGFVAAIAVALWQYGGAPYGIAGVGRPWLAALVLTVLGLVGLMASHALDKQQPKSRLADIADRYVAGWLAAAMAWLVNTSGPTFLMVMSWRIAPHATTLQLASPLGFPGMVSAGLALVGIAAAIVLRPELQKPRFFALAVTAIIFAAFSSAFGPAVLILCAAYLTGRHVTATLATIAGIWIFGSFYYWLGWPLASKGYLLFALGAALASVSLITGLKLPRMPQSSSRPARLFPAIVVGLVVLSMAATAVVIGPGIVAKERLIAEGRRIFIRLGPVDPRSLMQGDYMRLAFRLPRRTPPELRRTSSQIAWALADLSGNGVADIKQLTATEPKAASGQIVIQLRRNRSQWTVATNAYYFPEGTAKKFEAARYGEFRIGNDGTPILIGLADETLRPIRP